jgi:hypothetical protein
VVLLRVCIILIVRRSLPECNSLEKQLKVRSYDYVNRPYEHVRDVLQKDALKVFQAATKAAASRAQTIASELHIEFGGIGVKTDINITVKSVEEKVAEAGVGPITRLLLEWEATAMPRLFPLMKGELTNSSIAPRLQFLPDFSLLCRTKGLIFFRPRGLGRTHNPLVADSIPGRHHCLSPPVAFQRIQQREAALITFYFS